MDDMKIVLLATGKCLVVLLAIMLIHEAFHIAVYGAFGVSSWLALGDDGRPYAACNVAEMSSLSAEKSIELSRTQYFIDSDPVSLATLLLDVGLTLFVVRKDFARIGPSPRSGGKWTPI